MHWAQKTKNNSVDINDFIGQKMSLAPVCGFDKM